MMDMADNVYVRALQWYEKNGVQATSRFAIRSTTWALFFRSHSKRDEVEKTDSRELEGYEKVLGPENITNIVPAINTNWSLRALLQRESESTKATIIYSKARV
jgi:hypothetical protein